MGYMEGSGLGTPLQNAGAPTNGTSGTHAGIAAPGARLIDTTNGVLYVNTNTQASPTWTRVGDQRLDGGAVASGILRIAANVSDTETVTIGDDTYEFDTDSQVTEGNIAVDVSGGATPAAATDALVSAINQNTTEAVTAIDGGDETVIIIADSVGADSTATTETMAGVGNAWDAVTLEHGAAQAVRSFAALTRVPIATEVTAGALSIALGFTPTIILIAVRVTATGIDKFWNGGYSLDETNNVLTLDNDGDTDWAATDTITVWAME